MKTLPQGKPVRSPQTAHTPGAIGHKEDEEGQQQSGPSIAGFGSSLALGSAVLILGGYWLDHRAGGGNTRTLAGLGLALVYVVYETWKLVRRLSASDRKHEPDGGQPPAENQRL